MLGSFDWGSSYLGARYGVGGNCIVCISVFDGIDDCDFEGGEMVFDVRDCGRFVDDLADWRHDCC